MDRHMLTADEELRLMEAHARGDARATRRVVAAHQPLVHAMARRATHGRHDVDDLVQEANIGLIKAMDRFDPDRGARLNTVARWWIRAQLTGYTVSNHSLLSAPGTQEQRRLFFRLGGIKARMGIMDAGPLPREAITAIAAELDVTEQDVAIMNERLSPLAETSLNAPAGEDQERISLLADPMTVQDLEDRIDDDRRLAAIRAALDTLKPRQREVLERRYLLGDGETLGEIGDDLGITREGVRQNEVRAIEGVRKALARSGVRLAA